MVQIKDTEDFPYTVEEQFEEILDKGGNILCDKTTNVDPDATDLPLWYNDKKFNEGKSFFKKNIYSVLTCNLVGLIAVISVPSIMRVLAHTKKSYTPVSSYRRYLATVLHMRVWYEDSFYPGSDLWKSMSNVRAMHCAASTSIRKTGQVNGITQRDMALTQFGFMGLVLVRTRKMGMQATDEELEGFVHFWRVMGWVLGIEDRFNICRPSVSETRQLCSLILQNVFSFTIRIPSPDFKEMSESLLKALWCLNPFLCINAFTAFILYLIKPNNSTDQEEIDKGSQGNNNMEHNKTTSENLKNRTKDLEKKNWDSLIYKVIEVPPKYVNFNDDIYLNWWNWLVLTVMIWLHKTLLHYRAGKAYFNNEIKSALFIIQTFPFLAFYQFGVKKSYVKIFNNKKNEKFS